MIRVREKEPAESGAAQFFFMSSSTHESHFQKATLLDLLIGLPNKNHDASIQVQLADYPSVKSQSGHYLEMKVHILHWDSEWKLNFLYKASSGLSSGLVSLFVDSRFRELF